MKKGYFILFLLLYLSFFYTNAQSIVGKWQFVKCEPEDVRFTEAYNGQKKLVAQVVNESFYTDLPKEFSFNSDGTFSKGKYSYSGNTLIVNDKHYTVKSLSDTEMVLSFDASKYAAVFDDINFDKFTLKASYKRILGATTTITQHTVNKTDKVETTVQKEKSDNSVELTADAPPVYPGGEQAMFAFIGANLRYPAIAAKNGIQGRTVVRFVVGKDGNIRDIEVMSGFNKDCDEEAVRVISLMPKWTPGKEKGQPVSVYYTIPLSFRLTN